MITVRETQKSFILESDGCNREGATIQGARVGKVIVPKSEILNFFENEEGMVFEWEEIGVERGNVNDLFGAAASRSIDGVRIVEMRVIQ